MPHCRSPLLALIGALSMIASAAWAAPPSSASASGAFLAKLRGETDSEFAVRILKLKENSDPHLFVAAWNGVRTLFVDYVRGADTEAPERPLFALEETAPGRYRKLQVTVGETEGGEPDIAAFGFANADHDPAK